MLNSTPKEPDAREVERIVREGPSGAVALAGIATLVVVAIWFAFYFFVFSPRALP
jgi:hypothetical protein